MEQINKSELTEEENKFGKSNNSIIPVSFQGANLKSDKSQSAFKRISDNNSERFVRLDSKITHWMIAKDILSTTGPLFLATILGSASGIIGMIFVSQYDNHLTSAGPLINSAQTLLMQSAVSIFYVSTAKISIKAGQENYSKIGFLVRSSLLTAAVISLPVITAMATIQFPLAMLKQPKDDIALTASYMQIYTAGVIPNLSNFVYSQLFMATNRTRPLIAMNLAALLVETGLGYLMINGYLGNPISGLSGLSLARVLQAWTTFLGVTAYLKFRDTDIFNFSRDAASDYFKNFKKLLRLGLPISAYTATQLFVELLQTVIVGWGGEKSLALLQSLVAYAYTLVPSTLAFSISSSVHVGMQNGKVNPGLAKRYGNMGCILSTGVAITSGIFANIFAVKITSLFTETKDYEEDIRYLFLLISVAQIIEAVRQNHTANLRGLNDIVIPTVINLMTTLALILPLSFLLNWATDSGLFSVLGAQTVGLLIGGGLITCKWMHKINQSIKAHYYQNLSQEGSIKTLPNNNNRDETGEPRGPEPRESNFCWKFFRNPNPRKQSEVTSLINDDSYDKSENYKLR